MALNESITTKGAVKHKHITEARHGLILGFATAEKSSSPYPAFIAVAISAVAALAKGTCSPKSFASSSAARSCGGGEASDVSILEVAP